MLIRKVEITNYKSFWKAASFEFGPGLNIISGPNNVGKTALVEALSLRFTEEPHRSTESIPIENQAPAPESAVEVTFSLTGQELADLLSSEVTDFVLPRERSGADEALQALEALKSRADIQVAARWVAIGRAEPGLMAARFVEPPLPASRAWHQYQRKATEAKPRWIQDITTDKPGPLPLAFALAQSHRRRIYAFESERQGLGSAPFGSSSVLHPNAANLAEVLDSLSSHFSKFEMLNAQIRRVLPQLERVTLRPTPGNANEILVWEGSESDRIDLAIPLAASGTGIGQVVAILYALTTATTPQCLIVEEPNTYLHPGAVQALIEILRTHPIPHQFILTTHSPEVVAASQPRVIYLLRKERRETRSVLIDANDLSQVRALLREVGANLASVFGADRIVWVEGESEEACFPILASDVLKAQLRGTTFLAVLHTGDFDRKGQRFKERVVEIYDRLTKGAGLLPPATAFVFDGEARSSGAKETLDRLSGGRVRFLKRRTLENYFLLPDAISAVLGGLHTFRADSPPSPTAVKKWIDDNATDGTGSPRYGARTGPENLDAWRAEVNGAKLMEDLFQALSGAKEEYRKTLHAPMFTRWLAANRPGELEEILVLLREVLESDSAGDRDSTVR